MIVWPVFKSYSYKQVNSETPQYNPSRGKNSLKMYLICKPVLQAGGVLCARFHGADYLSEVYLPGTGTIVMVLHLVTCYQAQFTVPTSKLRFRNWRSI